MQDRRKITGTIQHAMQNRRKMMTVIYQKKRIVQAQDEQ